MRTTAAVRRPELLGHPGPQRDGRGVLGPGPTQSSATWPCRGHSEGQGDSHFWGLCCPRPRQVGLRVCWGSSPVVFLHALHEQHLPGPHHLPLALHSQRLQNRLRAAPPLSSQQPAEPLSHRVRSRDRLESSPASLLCHGTVLQSGRGRQGWALIPGFPAGRTAAPPGGGRSALSWVSSVKAHLRAGDLARWFWCLSDKLKDPSSIPGTEKRKSPPLSSLGQAARVPTLPAWV
ncbi:uncharacterized protein LOC104859306 isoform X1 [Fukomys damarensis]|uniref:uncharacterized protein LOC104859306 isoform X1 n=1 Tax=Fukomys damarensis TaxID=885580 RepID=UPI00053FB023|nr:uncharacterized protein LOC104859306 isoform X1 [Fukomys damarensis]